MAHSLNILNEGLDSLFEAVEKCCICGKEIDGEGNNAEPVCEGRCCDECNTNVVIPERMKQIRLQHKENQTMKDESLDEAEEQMSKNEKTGAAIGTVAGGVDGAITGQMIGKAVPMVASKIAGKAAGTAIGAKVAGTAVGKAIGTAVGAATPWIGDEVVMGAIGAGVGTAIGALAGRKSGKKIGKELDNVESENKSVEESLTEAVGTPGTEKIYSMIEDGLLTAEQVVDMCLKCMSEQDIQWMVHTYELDVVDESLKEADDEHEETEQEKHQREVDERHKAWMSDMYDQLYSSKVKNYSVRN